MWSVLPSNSSSPSSEVRQRGEECLAEECVLFPFAVLPPLDGMVRATDEWRSALVALVAVVELAVVVLALGMMTPLEAPEVLGG